MSDDKQSGSDLDIFEGLGKKSTPRAPAAPPPPPGSNAQLANADRARPSSEWKKTMIGVPPPASPSQTTLPATSPSPVAPPVASSAVAAPPTSTPGSLPPPPTSGRLSAPPPPPASASGTGRLAASGLTPTPSKPPPPPGRASLPNVSGPASSPGATGAATPSLATTQKSAPIPPPPSTRQIPGAPSTASTLSTTAAIPKASPSGSQNLGKLDMDWDDDEATHVFDKEARESQPQATASSNGSAASTGPESKLAEHANMDQIMSSPRPSAPAPATSPVPPAPASLSGQFGALGEPSQPAASGRELATNGAASVKAPPSQAARSAPPPPPGSLRHLQNSAPPPPPPGQTTTAPMHMPLPPPPAVVVAGSVPAPQPQHTEPLHAPVAQQAAHSAQRMPNMPPVSRAMDATAVVPRQQPSRTGLWVAFLMIVAAVGLGVFFMMPRTGTLVVNVADVKGAAVSKLEISVDGRKACESAPCIVKDVSAGVHEVKVAATGFEPPAARAVTIEGRKDSTLDFALSPARAAGGTGIKVAASSLQTGARLLVDGKDQGALPQEVRDLTPGEHQIKIVGGDRYAPFEKTVDVKDGELTDLGSVALKVLKGKATIQLGTPGAKVYLVSGTNRKEVPQDRFPIAIEFDPNEKWQLEAKMFGMDDYSQPVTFEDGQAEKTFVVALKPKGTNLTSASIPRAAAPAPVAAAPAAPKEPALAAPKAAAAAPAAEPKEPAGAASNEAFLNINSRPASTVLLDGKPLGPTPRVKVSVTPGTHTVLFVNAEESLKKSMSVTVGAGETKAVAAKLRD